MKCNLLYFDMVGSSAASLKTGADPVPEKWCCISYINFNTLDNVKDRLCGLVVRVSGYRYRGPGFDARRYQIF